MDILNFIFIMAVFSVNLVSCSEKKVSVAFVIDDTASMADDIAQVIDSFDSIFDAAINSNKSQIENFVLVTFNDPTTEVRAVTKDRNVFKNALSSITVVDGNDCPEYSMSGLKLALEQSLPGSYIYVFTDASAKDYELYEEVKRMAVQRKVKLSFVVTGSCGSEDIFTGYQLYHNLTTVTSGHVYVLYKKEIKDVLNAVRYTVEGSTALIASKMLYLSQDPDLKFNFTVDVGTKELLVTSTGKDPVLDITGPDGRKPTVRGIVNTQWIKVIKLLDVKPGVYIVRVSNISDSVTDVTVVALSV